MIWDTIRGASHCSYRIVYYVNTCMHHTTGGPHCNAEVRTCFMLGRDMLNESSESGYLLLIHEGLFIAAQGKCKLDCKKQQIINTTDSVCSGSYKDKATRNYATLR